VCSYNSARTAEKFLEYIKEQLQADSGFARVDALDDLVRQAGREEGRTCPQPLQCIPLVHEGRTLPTVLVLLFLQVKGFTDAKDKKAVIEKVRKGTQVCGMVWDAQVLAAAPFGICWVRLSRWILVAS
jgi:hypothetical protein